MYRIIQILTIFALHFSATISYAESTEAHGVFSIQHFGALGDGSADDGPAIQRTIQAAISYSGNGERNGTVYIPPTTASWRVGTPIYIPIHQAGGASASKSMHLRIVGHGVDGPIKCAVGAAQDCLKILVTLTEWFRGSIEDVAFLGTYQSGAATDCQTALVLGASPVGARWSVKRIDVLAIGASKYGIEARGTGGSFTFEDINNAGTYVEGTSGRFLYLNEVAHAEIARIGQFYEVQYRGVSHGAGGGTALIGVKPYDSNVWRTTVNIRGMRTDIRWANAVHIYPPSGTARTASVKIEDSSSESTTSFVTAFYVNELELNRNQINAVAANFLADLYGVTSFRAVGNKGTNGLKIRADAQTTNLNIIASDAFSAFSAAPAGIEAPGGAATITVKNLRARVLRADGSFAANTLVIQSADTDFRVTQVNAGGLASAVTGVALDAASAIGDYVRVAGTGEIVKIKSDGTATIARGAPVGVSTSSAGRIMQISSGAQIGRALSSAPATTDTLVDVLLLPGIMP